MTYNELGAVAPTSLGEARLVAHYAAQIAAAASTRIDAKADFSHTNLGWDAALSALTTHPIAGKARGGLRLQSLELLVITEGSVTSQSLLGLDMAAGLSWLQRTLDQALGSSLALKLPEHDMPPHALADGAVFAVDDSAGLAELARWFFNASEALSKVAAAHDAASPARCWPHHFDLATLITVAEHDDPEQASSVGVGMSPGDGSYDEPYWYVNPWPTPDASDLLPLEVGGWHSEGWIGAVLTGSSLVASSAQGDTLTAFLSGAIAACMKLVRR